MPMKRTALATLLFALPAAAFALDFQHGDDGYVDAPRFSAAERAAVSVLTDIGAVSGNPDGSFAVHRTLNRAEFAKIALLSMGSDVSSSDAASCFPDVPADAWFSRYVCRAKVDGIVQGNPDGLFHPERDVNYAEAVKILVELAGYELPQPAPTERWAWYTGYMRAAAGQGVELTESVDPGSSLVRGQMARLAAAFVAEAEGELDVYRDAERGEFAESSSSRSSSSSSVSVSSSSSSSISSSSSRSSAASVSLYPAKNSFFLTGERSPLVLGGAFVSQDEASVLRVARLTLRREITSIDKVFVVDANGATIVELLPSTSNNSDKRKWEATTPDGTYVFAANAPVKLGVVFLLKPKDGGGGSNQLIETESFQIQTETQATGSTKYLFADSQVYPVHQTSFGRLTRATSALPAIGTVRAGSRRQIASVRVNAQTATGGSVYLRGIDFLVTMSDVTVSNIVIGDAATGVLADCGLDKQERIVISCGQLPDGLSLVPAAGLTVSVYADLALSGPGNGQLSMKLEKPGRIGDTGSFTWSDTSGQFTWIEEGLPFGGDVSWTVQP